MSFINYFLILISITYLGVKSDTAPVEGIDYPGISCGKKNPKKEKDCTKYGTDSGMLCCWIAKVKGGEGQCTLLSQKTAEETFHFKGENEFDGNSEWKYWSCGNKSFYLRTDIFLILIVLALLF